MPVASWCFTCCCGVLGVCFCTGHFVMVLLNSSFQFILTYLHCLQHSFFEHFFNLYFWICKYSNRPVGRYRNVYICQWHILNEDKLIFRQWCQISLRQVDLTDCWNRAIIAVPLGPPFHTRILAIRIHLHTTLWRCSNVKAGVKVGEGRDLVRVVYPPDPVFRTIRQPDVVIFRSW